MRTDLSFPRERFYANTVGLDSFIDEVFGKTERQSFPPYNLLKRGDEYIAEFALAGYDRDAIDISVETNHRGVRYLTIQGSGTDELEEGVEYLTRGLATRKFEQRFALGQHVEVTGAEFTDGILRVTLEQQVPEELQPKRIEIK